jgi:hypothetical protein
VRREDITSLTLIKRIFSGTLWICDVKTLTCGGLETILFWLRSVSRLISPAKRLRSCLPKGAVSSFQPHLQRQLRTAVSLSPMELAMPEPGRIDRRRAALIAYDVCRRALTPSDPARRAAMRPVLDAWVQMIAAVRAGGR